MSDDVKELSYHYLSDQTLMSKDFAYLMKYYWTNSQYTNYFNLFNEGWYYPTLQHECFANAERYQDFLASCAYQWYYYDTSSKTWVADNRFQSKKIIFRPTAEENGRQYKCIASYAEGSVTSNTVTITGSTTTPIIRYNPQSIVVLTDDNNNYSYSFSITVHSTYTDVTYQWYYSKDSGTTWHKIRGEIENEYTRENMSYDRGSYDGYQFKCLVTYNGTTTESTVAKLTVKSSYSNEFKKQPSNVNYTTYSSTGISTTKIALSADFSVTGTGLIEQIDGLKNNLGISSTSKKKAQFKYGVQPSCSISTDPAYNIRYMGATGATDKIAFMECRETGWA